MAKDFVQISNCRHIRFLLNDKKVESCGTVPNPEKVSGRDNIEKIEVPNFCLVNISKHIVNSNFFIFEKYVNLYKEQEEKYKKEI